jgi:hypothetical protein
MFLHSEGSRQLSLDAEIQCKIRNFHEQTNNLSLFKKIETF